MSMMPNTSVRPAASRNSISPNCRPLSPCSRIRIQDRSALLHAAFLDVGIAVVLEHRADGLVHQAALRVLAHHPEIVVLDGILVAVELERAAHGVELGRSERLAYRFYVLDLAFHVAHRGVEEQRSVI